MFVFYSSVEMPEGDEQRQLVRGGPGIRNLRDRMEPMWIEDVSRRYTYNVVYLYRYSRFPILELMNLSNLMKSYQYIISD